MISLLNYMSCRFFWVKFGNAFTDFVVSCLLHRWYIYINIQTEYILITQTELCLKVPGSQGKYIFCTRKLLSKSILNDFNAHLFLTAHDEKGSSTDKVESCTECYLKNSMVSQTERSSKGYHSLVP